jgi:hypothetical protein
VKASTVLAAYIESDHRWHWSYADFRRDPDNPERLRELTRRSLQRMAFARRLDAICAKHDAAATRPRGWVLTHEGHERVTAL